MTALELAALWRENRARLARDHGAPSLHARGRPAHLKIELTNFCNLSCPMCPHERMTRDVGYMRPELFRRIIDQAAPELEFAYLHHLGESLFHPRLGELVRYGRSRGAAMGLSTNATFLDGRKAAALLESGLDFLVVSLDAATSGTYARTRPGGDFAVTVENVRAFLALRRRLGAHTDVAVQLIVLEENRAEVAAFAAEWAKEGVGVMIKEARDWAGQVPLGRVTRPLRAPCRMPWTELTILWDGLVVPCANVYERTLVLGDLRVETLDQIWNGPAMQALRAAHAGDDVAAVPVCSGCPRHALDAADFVTVGQLAQRRRHYLAQAGLTPRPGLS